MTGLPSTAELARQREHMVEQQLRARGVDDELVLAAMRRVRREHYVDPAFVRRSYDDSALPIARGQTISQPYIVGYMVQALRLGGGERVLEVGTGYGYAAAVLAEIAGQVFTIERQRELADEARQRLAQDGRTNVVVRCGDGSPAAAVPVIEPITNSVVRTPPKLPIRHLDICDPLFRGSRPGVAPGMWCDDRPLCPTQLPLRGIPRPASIGQGVEDWLEPPAH